MTKKQTKKKTTLKIKRTLLPSVSSCYQSINQAPWQKQSISASLLASQLLGVRIKRCSLWSFWGTAWPRWRSGPGGDIAPCCGSTDRLSSADSEPAARSSEEKEKGRMNQKKRRSADCYQINLKGVQVEWSLGWRVSGEDERRQESFSRQRKLNLHELKMFYKNLPPQIYKKHNFSWM